MLEKYRHSGVSHPYYSGLEGYDFGGLKLKTQQNTHAAIQWFKKEHVLLHHYVMLLTTHSMEEKGGVKANR
jgi:hypothetical protein